MKERFHHFSLKISNVTGSAWAFSLAILGVVVWAITGPMFHFSDTWLLTITTLTDVVVFLMVFSLQYSQNRDSRAIQLKLNELIVADKTARDTFVGLESLTDEELTDIDGEFKKLLGSLEPAHVMHKLHKKITDEKAHRSQKAHFTDLANEAGHLVGNLLTGHQDKE